MMGRLYLTLRLRDRPLLDRQIQLEREKRETTKMKFALQRQAEREKIEMQLQAERELSNMTHNNAGFIGARSNDVASVQKLLHVMHDTCDVLTFFVGLQRALEMNNVEKESWGEINSLTIKSPGTQGFRQRTLKTTIL